jgi:hypothetical protein
MRSGEVGGRTTWWCSAEQLMVPLSGLTRGKDYPPML